MAGRWGDPSPGAPDLEAQAALAARDAAVHGQYLSGLDKRPMGGPVRKADVACAHEGTVG